MYDFCPLDLYSGDVDRMRSAIMSLIREPHKNLRVFIDGNLVHSDDSPLPLLGMSMAFFPDGSADVDTLVTVVCFNYIEIIKHSQEMKIPTNKTFNMTLNLDKLVSTLF